MDAVYVVQNLVFSAATGAKTALNLIAGANQPITLLEWGVSFDGVTASAVPATVQLCQSTQATAGTGAASAPAIVQTSGRVYPAQHTSAHNFTAEPTALTVIEHLFVPQFMGAYVKQYPLGLEPDSDLSAGAVKALAIRVNTSATVNCLAYMRFSIGG